MPNPQRITIIGGGLAGLALGAALAREGAAVTLLEAGRLPRPRVCGEFISGLKSATIARLGLAPHLRDATVNHTTGWYTRGRLRWSAKLPEPALGLSRPVLEERLLHDFTTAGGELRQNTRAPVPPKNEENMPGQIWAAGRRPDAASPWLGLKIHCRNLPAEHDLEVHLGRGGYVGVARIEHGRTNICGLFRMRSETRGTRETLLAEYLAACGMEKLAARLTAGDPDYASTAAVSGLEFTRTWRADTRVSIGDHHAAMPPYTGHGMALALENAAAALDPLLAYARNEQTWPAAVLAIRHATALQQNSRLRWGRRLHPWLLHPFGQSLLLTLADFHLLPFNFFYQATHGSKSLSKIPSSDLATI
ncbi:MAG TPA: FAD-dependent monooxygenase [Opitutales bacterium]|jgi:2-polyprenyl-6-methoxyphenol hydroxylase-like FAD-dependent oxidoreductase|nr:FAD-dependent monooxygenase [Opitutales bacterium]